MSQPITILREITLGDYVAMTDGWNAAHESDNDPIEPPTAEEWEREQIRILNNPSLTGVVAN